MENETQRSLSKRLGITTLDVLKKAAELERLMNVRGCSMNLTSVSKSVICLEIAANNSQVPMNRVLKTLHFFLFICHEKHMTVTCNEVQLIFSPSISLCTAVLIRSLSHCLVS